MKTKRINVRHHFIEAADNEYFHKIKTAMDAINKSGETTAAFDRGDNHYLWKLNDIVDIDGVSLFVSLVKGRDEWPVWFSDNGQIDRAPINEGNLGDLFYAIINLDKHLIISLAAANGSAPTAFKHLLNNFTTEGGVYLTPACKNNAYGLAMEFDYYKKLSLSLKFPVYDDLAEFKATREGGLVGIIDELGGLKADVTIATNRGKQVLNAAQVREIIVKFMDNDFCSKLTVKGADFDNQICEEFDIKNAQIQYTEKFDISGNYLSESEAFFLLKRAFYDTKKELFGGVQ